MRLPYPLDNYGYTGSSQNDEDGIINAILTHIAVPQYFVEFGAEPQQCNCLALYRKGWAGLFMDKQSDWDVIKTEKVTPGNINDLLRKYNVPDDFGVLSIDIDGQDIWVWEAMRHTPPLVIIEYNDLLPVDQPVAMVHDDNFPWPTVTCWGASLAALHLLGLFKGYVLVYCNHVNAFFVRRDCFANVADFDYRAICRPLKPERIKDPLAIGYVAYAPA